MIKKHKNIVLIFIAVFIVIFLIYRSRTNFNSSIVPAKDYPQIEESGVLHVVMDYSPAGFFRSGDSIYGKQYELVTQLSDHLNIPVKIHLETELQTSIDGLNNEKYDLIARFIPVTSQLKESVAFTENISLDRQVLIQRHISDTTSTYIHNQLELPGKKIYVTNDSPYIPRLKNLANEIGDTIEVIEIADYECEHLMILVVKGDIDYAVCDYETALRMQKEFPSLDIATNISFSQLQAWAVRKESPQLLDSINAWIRNLKASGK